MLPWWIRWGVEQRRDTTRDKDLVEECSVNLFPFFILLSLFWYSQVILQHDQNICQWFCMFTKGFWQLNRHDCITFFVISCENRVVKNVAIKKNHRCLSTWIFCTLWIAYAVFSSYVWRAQHRGHWGQFLWLVDNSSWSWQTVDIGLK